MTTTTTPIDQAHLTELRATLRKAADLVAERDGNASELDVERYIRLAEYCVARAEHHATTGTETSKPMFGLAYVSLALLEPPGTGHYDDPVEYPELAFRAVQAITEHASHR